jgi:hypothetical protein
MKTLAEVQNILDHIEFINNGGCAISALSMYRWLQKYDNAEHVYFYYCHYDKSDSYKNNKAVLTSKKGKPQGCSHVVLYKDKKCIDSGGVVDVTEYKYTLRITDINFVLESINNVSAWSSLFDRNSIKEIEEKLGIDLSDIIIN